MAELGSALREINDSLKATTESLGKLKDQYRSGSLDVNAGFMKYLGKDGSSTDDKVSLLSLKNGSMLAYLNSLMLVLNDKMDTSGERATAEEARERSVQHRVVLERGIKPLEKKLSYQLDKLTRAYNRMEKEYNDAEARAAEKSELGLHGADGDDDGDDDSSSDEELSYRPNTAGLVASSKGSSARRGEGEQEEQEDEGEGDDEKAVYRPPKISAMLPPQQGHFEDRFIAREHKDKSNRSRMQAMEDYIRESSDQPDWESSIGANIVNHGRGGIKSLRDTEKERRVTNYEEENFTRLNVGASSLEKKKQKQRERMAKVNIIGGEDFSIFNSKRKLTNSTSRQSKKPRGAWDRAKRRL
ncbi:U3 small nucleolar ribonucleoprotein LCP5 [Nakaseomyces bracarensis]|uniref:U3 small nucleolar ribonucleoprotein LCP5 n=1 Tax=Nakaseomyces bracarensis TaxID=273131 RepID=A0ABR4NW83_9SACH